MEARNAELSSKGIKQADIPSRKINPISYKVRAKNYWKSRETWQDKEQTGDGATTLKV